MKKLTTGVPALLHCAARAMFHYSFPHSGYKRLTAQRWREVEIELALLPALVDPRREAVDVGANVGHYTLQLSELTQRVHAFEPHPRLAYVLRRSMPGNVVIHQQAVSDKPGSATLTVPYFGRPVEGMASLSADSDTFQDASRLARIKVACTTLDSLANRNIGFVKVDVEGHEASVLAGASALIDRQRPSFLVEVEERHCVGAIQAAFDTFSRHDYVGWFVCRDVLRPVEAFSMEMQDTALIVPKATRTSYDYVNNFIFVARETWSTACAQRLSDLLTEARRSSQPAVMA